MSLFGASRAQHLRRRGRDMILRRSLTITSHVDVTVRGFARQFTPEQMTGNVRQGDEIVEIGSVEIAAVVWPGPPRARDILVIDGKVWSVEGAVGVYDGPTVIGHTLHVRGG